MTPEWAEVACAAIGAFAACFVAFMWAAVRLGTNKHQSELLAQAHANDKDKLEHQVDVAIREREAARKQLVEDGARRGATRN